jgi:arginyl-tRNA synthetase
VREKIIPLIERWLAPLQDEFGMTVTREMIELPHPPDPSMGDYALNLPLRLAKLAKKPPMVIAQRIAELMAAQSEWFSSAAAVPPGYVNLTITDSALARLLDASEHDVDLGLRKLGEPETVVVDYSGVNIAKQMHVGHLRSNIIGDAIARTLEARGGRVIRQSHLGDWGLPIAMVLWKATPELRRVEAEGKDPLQEITLTQLEDFYREATAASKTDPTVAEEVHQNLVRLQNGDPQLLADWQTITRISMQAVYTIYDELGVSLRPDDERGESFYRDMLADTVASLDACGVLVESRGAKCVFLPQFKGKDGQPLPVIVQKTDGAFNYDTFDLAAIRFRIRELGADRIIYVTDARQALHFAQAFGVAHACGWTHRESSEVGLEHVTFGSVLGEDGKPLKTRSGENVKLAELLQEAVDRAYAVVNEKNPYLPEERKRQVARAVGIGAIKYADLSIDRNRDYVFAWDRMLALNGNTAPYLQYAHARICSIFRRGGIDEEAIAGPPAVTHPAERALALKLLGFPEVVAEVEKELRPHTLCTYLYELAAAFSTFYDNCPVLTAETDTLRASRLFLCRVTQETLARALDLLGIQAPREM